MTIPVETSIFARFSAVAEAHAHRLAVEDDERAWRYGELRERAVALARRLVEAGGTEPVALLRSHDAPMVAAVLGVLGAGRFYVPLDPSLPAERQRALLGDAGARLLCCDAAHRAAAETLASSGDVLLVEDDACAAGPRYPPLPTVSPDALAYLLYTSGSTGRPKGVLQTHASLAHHALTYAASLALTAPDRLSLVASYAFDASLMDLFGALLTGASLHLWDLRARGVEGLPAWLRDRGVTVYHATPTVYRALARALSTGERLPAIRRVVLGGEAVRARDVAMFQAMFPPGAVLVNGYGPTESTLALQAFYPAVGPPPEEPVAIGRPVTDTEVLLLDEEGHPCDGEGEIALRSRHLAVGYWRDPERTRASFLADPEGQGRRLYRTGDRGLRLPDGSLAFAGRRDGRVKVRGQSVDLGALEMRLAAEPAVGEAAVVATVDAQGETRLTGFLVPRCETPTSTDALLRCLRAELPGAMVPARLLAVEKLPLTVGGKIDREALRALARVPPLAAGAPPATPTERRLAAIWRELLDVETVDRESDFFALGGSSLSLTRLAARIGRLLGVKVALPSLFDASTLGAMAGTLDAACLAAPLASPSPIAATARERDLPLSFAQERLWFLDRLAPGQAVYHVYAALRLRGPVEETLLQRALDVLVERHEALRTTFPTEDRARPRQAIARNLQVSLERRDYAALPAEERLGAAQRRACETIVRPFHLARGPLLRAELLVLAPDDRIFVFVLHHAVADGWSMSLLTGELGTAYRAFQRGAAPSFPPLALSYADHAAWQRAPERVPLLDAELAWWRTRLDGAPLLQLPTDRPRPPVQTTRGALVSLPLAPALLARAGELGRATSTTPFMVHLAAFLTLLHRWTGEDDVAVATPIAGRTRAETDALVGTFVSTLVLRTDLGGDPSFRRLLARVREVCLGAYAHQELPFEKLIEALAPSRDPSRHPLFQVMFAVHDMPPAALDLGGGEAEPLALDPGTALCDLTLSLRRASGGMAATFEYNTDLFDGATVERMARQYLTLLHAATTDPDRSIGRLPLLPDEERRRLLLDFQTTTRPYDLSRPIHRLVEEQAARTPEQIAAVAGSASLSYGALDGAAGALAHRLARAGVRRGHFVPVVLERGLDLVVALLGVMKTGAAFTPLDPRWPAARRAAAIAELPSPAVVVAEADDPSTPALGRTYLSVSRVAGDPPLPTCALGDAADPIYAIYTSGSTGRPKAVVIPHRGIANRFRWMNDHFGSAPPVVLQTTPPVYDSAVWQLFWPLTLGGTTVLPRDEDVLFADAVTELIARHGVTLTDFVPSVFAALLPRLLGDAALRARLATLGHLVLGGEAIDAAATARFQAALPHVRITNLYGPTEASIGCIAHELVPGEPEPIPIGRPIANAHALLLDRRGELVPLGAVGEIHLGGACLGLGYLGDAAATRRAFVESPHPEVGERLYRTGDLARLRADGELLFLGRADRQLKIRGLRVEPGEVEAALRRHPDVEDALVTARDDGAGPRLVAYLVGGEPPPPDVLRAFLRTSLPETLVPSAYVVLDRLPRSPSGKLDRGRLPPPPLPARDPPRGPLEERIAGVFGRALGLAAPSRDANFFDLGAHSLLLATLHPALEAIAGRPLPLVALFRHPTIRDLARFLDGDAPPEPLPPLRSPPPRPAWPRRRRALLKRDRR